MYVTYDLDEEEFRERFKKFKISTNNGSSHEFSR
jgi:hypothetical protein